MSVSCDPMDCSPPGSSVHEISQARILEWVAIPSPLLYSQSWVSSESCSACYFLVIFFSPASGSFILCLCRSVLNLNSKTLSSDLSSSLSLSEQLSSLWYSLLQILVTGFSELWFLCSHSPRSPGCLESLSLHCVACKEPSGSVLGQLQNLPHLLLFSMRTWSCVVQHLKNCCFICFVWFSNCVI